MISGETERHGGELAFQKGNARGAARPTAAASEQDMTLREYVLSGARDLVQLEQELAQLEQAMAGSVHDQATMKPLCRGAGEARARGAATAGGDHATSVLRGLGFRGGAPRPVRCGRSRAAS